MYEHKHHRKHSLVVGTVQLPRCKRVSWGWNWHSRWFCVFAGMLNMYAMLIWGSRELVRRRRSLLKEWASRCSRSLARSSSRNWTRTKMMPEMFETNSDAWDVRDKRRSTIRRLVLSQVEEFVDLELGDSRGINRCWKYSLRDFNNLNPIVIPRNHSSLWNLPVKKCAKQRRWTCLVVGVVFWISLRAWSPRAPSNNLPYF